MNFLSLRQFLEHFQKRGSNDFETFMNKASVRARTKLLPLREYIKDKDVDLRDLKLLFETIRNREEYLTRFYTVSLKVEPDKFSLTSKEPMKNRKMNNNAEVYYKNVIRNMHWKDILKNTKSGIANIPTYMDVLEDLYLHNIIDYKLLTPSSIHYMRNGKTVFSSYYFRASIMNPYLVYSLNQSVLKGTRIFTPTLGWTSYAYGFLECPNVVHYVGTDVILSVCGKTQKFADTFYKNKSVDIYCEPSENLHKNRGFMKKYGDYFDVVFFSPPYYELEKYPGKKQSIIQYKTYEEWLQLYWETTIQLCHRVLQKGGKLCYILSGYGSENTNGEYDLLTDMNGITKKYFSPVSSQPMFNRNVDLTQHKETKEMIMIYKKT
jgi:hypothetical protein